MKKLIIAFAFALMSSIAFSQTIIVNGAKITLASTAELEVQFNNMRSVTTTAYVVIVTSPAGVQVGTETITASHYNWPAGSKVPITFTNGIINVRLKGAIGDVISITF